MVSGNSITELLKQRVFDSNLTRFVPALLSLSFCLLTCRTVFILGKRHNNFFKVALSIIRLASRFRRVRRHFTTEPDGFTNSCMFIATGLTTWKAYGGLSRIQIKRDPERKVRGGPLWLQSLDRSLTHPEHPVPLHPLWAEARFAVSLLSATIETSRASIFLIGKCTRDSCNFGPRDLEP